MNRLSHSLVLFLLLACNAAAAQKVQNEGLVRELGPDWTAMYEISLNARYNAIELVPKGYSLRNWREVVRISDFSGASNHSAEDLLKEH